MNYYQQYVEHLHQLHDLIKQNADEGEEGELLRDQMDVVWKHLSEEEKESLRQLSASLY